MSELNDEHIHCSKAYLEASQLLRDVKTRNFRKWKRDYSYSETNKFFAPSFQYCQNTPIRAVPLISRPCAKQYFDFLKISHWIQRRRRFFLKREQAEWSTHGEFGKKFTVQEYPVSFPYYSLNGGQIQWKMNQQEGIAHMRSISYFAKNIVSGLNCLCCWKGSASIVSSVQSSSRQISRLFATRNNINGWGKNTCTVLFQK